LKAPKTMVAIGLTVWTILSSALFLLFSHMPSHHAKSRHSSQRATSNSPARVSILFGGIATLFIMKGLFSKRTPSPYGDARWADDVDIRRAGLLGGQGIILGSHEGRTLCMPGWEHIMCFAPSGSGKGVGIVIPNLLHWPDSVIVHDVKGENFRLTSGFRAMHGQKVFFLNPGDPQGLTHRYNPFQFVSENPGLRIDDIQKIAHYLIPQHGFWENEARTLFLGLSLFLLDQPGRTVSMGQVLCTLRENNFYEMISMELVNQREKIDPVAFMALNAFIQKAEKERSAVLSTLNAALELWANPLIDAATSASDFDLRQLKKERISIYVGVSPNNLHRLRPLLQIFYQQATDILTEKEPDLKKEPYGVLFLMDEFASLGRMTHFEQASAYFRGYRVRFMMIIQDLPQLERHYERAGLHSFLGMSKVKVTFTADNYETAEVISKSLGTFGADTQSNSKSRKMGLSLNSGSRSESHSKMARALLLPQEVLQLPPDDEIILIEAVPPIRAKKIRYFEQPVFQKRLVPPISIPRVPIQQRKLTNIAYPAARLPTDEEVAALAGGSTIDLDQPEGIRKS